MMREPAALLLTAFLVAFVLTRAYTRVARARGWGSGSVGGVHLHHIVVGIVLVLVSGLIEFASRPGGLGRDALAVSFGVGGAFVLDEFALSLYLRDVYWSEEGHGSIDASLMGVLLAGLLLVGLSPFGVHDGGRVPRLAAFALVAANIALALVTFSKGKLTLGLLAVFVPGAGVIGAARLGKPRSLWGRRFYDDAKRARAERRFADPADDGDPMEGDEMTVDEFDVVVIGAGPAGEVCSGRLGEAGLRVAVVEGHLVGGECSFYGCMPSKALLRPAEAIAEARRIPGAAEVVNGDLDVEAVLRRRDEVIHDLDDSVQIPWLDQRGVTVVRGRARLTGARRVDVDGRALTASRAVVLATGSEAAVPPIPGLAEAQPWTNREATTSKRVPPRLIVLGGGVIGVELGQAWSTLGSQVTIVEALPHLLGREEPF